MKLKLISEYKSIADNDKKALESLDFSDFSIITGTNGSGKTHLLEGICRGQIQILDDDGHPDMYKIVYFNYTDFNFNCDKPLQKMPANYTFSALRQLKDSLLNFVRKDISDVVFAEFLFDYIKSDIDKKRRLVDKFVRERVPIEEYPDFNVAQNIFGVLEVFVSNYIHLIKDKKIEEIISLSKISNTEMGQCFRRICKTYFLDRAKHLLGDLGNVFDSKGRFNTDESRDDFIQSKGDDPLADFNKILKDIELNNYFFEEKFPLNEYDIICFSSSNPQRRGMDEFSQYQYNPSLSNGKISINIDGLSSGEQILLGLATFVYDQKRKKGENFVLLLDEVDTNLHPSMVNKLLNLIQNVFIKKYKLKVFLVTHSPTTVALAPENSVFVMHRSDESKPRIEQVSNEDALEVLTEGFATLDKGLKLLDQISKKEVSVFTEGNNAEYIKRALEYFGGVNKDKIDVVSDIDGITGQDQLRSYFRLFSKVKHDNLVFFVWDCDAKKLPEGSGKTAGFKFPKNSENQRVGKGVENLFPEKAFENRFYRTKPTHDGGERKSLDKNAFMKHMIENGTEKDFANFKPLFDKIDEALQKSAENK